MGKPSAVWPLDNSGLTVAAIRDDRVALLITGVDAGGSDWVPADNISADLAPDDQNPGVAIAVVARLATWLSSAATKVASSSPTRWH